MDHGATILSFDDVCKNIHNDYAGCCEVFLKIKP